ncbi:helix-turn-helix domain-containing protein [Pendulispora albinea]|uniref:AraC family transcriptional regulator n=1 Tax=Pendulispora albinea TaxID=2741071 RepID=A0ABZ2M4R2_9BACT
MANASNAARWATLLADPALLEHLFDRLPDVAFFVKDRQERYVMINETFLSRCGIQHKEQVLGRTAEDVFPRGLGAGYTAQDRLVLRTGNEIVDRLELHIYPDGQQGWCLTYKTPLRDGAGAIQGLAGISRDLHRPDERHPEYRRLAEAIDFLHAHYDESLRLEALTRKVGLSMDRFERLVAQVFHLTPRQLLTKIRVEAASRLLREGQASVAAIAHACGYSDHSAFTRNFRATVGLTPRAFRQRLAPGRAPDPGSRAR